MERKTKIIIVAVLIVFGMIAFGIKFNFQDEEKLDKSSDNLNIDIDINMTDEEIEEQITKDVADGVTNVIYAVLAYMVAMRIWDYIYRKSLSSKF